jgi:DNA-binding transcriptional MerR regulator
MDAGTTPGTTPGTTDEVGLRIGAVARRTGVAVTTLRAWEARYGLLTPQRTLGGHRLYGADDVDRVLAVLRLTAQGWAVSAAARAVTTGSEPERLRLVGGGVPDGRGRAVGDASPRTPRAGADRARADLAAAVAAFDADAATAALDGALSRLGVPHALEDVVMPVLRDLGEGWREDPGLIAVEHFATNVLRPRLHRLLAGAHRAAAPTCIAAAPDGEDHELGVLAAAAVAADVGLRVTYLGASTPSAALERSAATLRPDVVLVGAVTEAAARRFAAAPPVLGGAALVLGGPGFAVLDAAELPAGAGRAVALSSLSSVLRGALERGGATG